MLPFAEGEREQLVAEQINPVDFRFQCLSLISLVVGGLISWHVVITSINLMLMLTREANDYKSYEICRKKRANPSGFAPHRFV